MLYRAAVTTRRAQDEPTPTPRPHLHPPHACLPPPTTPPMTESHPRASIQTPLLFQPLAPTPPHPQARLPKQPQRPHPRRPAPPPLSWEPRFRGPPPPPHASRRRPAPGAQAAGRFGACKLRPLGRSRAESGAVCSLDLVPGRAGADKCGRAHEPGLESAERFGWGWNTGRSQSQATEAGALLFVRTTERLRQEEEVGCGDPFFFLVFWLVCSVHTVETRYKIHFGN